MAKKDWKAEFELQGYDLLDIGGPTTALTFRFICNRKHSETIKRAAWDRGSRCKTCKNEDKFSKLRELVEAEEYTWHGIERTQHGNRLKLTCPSNHPYEALLSNWNQGYRCRECKINVWTYDKVKALFEKESFTLLSKEYVRAHDHLSFICPEGHEHQVAFSAWLRGVRCGPCVKNYLPENIKEILLAADMELLSTPKDSCDRMSTRCMKCNHKKKIRYYEYLKQEVPCLKCIKDETKKEDVLRFVEAHGYVLQNDYTGSNNYLELKCLKDHTCKITWGNFQQGTRCSRCANRGSKPQEDLYAYYRSLGLEVQNNNRKLLYPKELDLVFEKEKVAIEYCGLYWHSKDTIPTSYHYDKMKKTNDLGYRLITIFEDEWLNQKEICLSRINSALKVQQTKVYARRCKIIQLDKNRAKEFLDINHLQGAGKFTSALGLELNGILVQVLTLGIPNRHHTSKGKKVLELKRLASLGNHTVVGGAGKLFKKMQSHARENNYEQIKSYCDMRWGTGNLYKQLGFTLSTSTKYTRHYVKGLKRLRGQSLSGKPAEETEEEYRIRKGYSTLYDCGHQTWVYDLGS